jgi:hypothetical protein
MVRLKIIFSLVKMIKCKIIFSLHQTRHLQPNNRRLRSFGANTLLRASRGQFESRLQVHQPHPCLFAIQQCANREDHMRRIQSGFARLRPNRQLFERKA